MSMLTVKETATLLKGFDNVLILTHVRPDGDTVGCAAALCAALRTLGKTAYLLPNPGLTDTTAPFFRPYEAPEGFVPEKVVSTDIATVNLLPENAKEYAGSIDLAMDHHVSFEHFAKENIVRSEAGAGGEQISSRSFIASTVKRRSFSILPSPRTRAALPTATPPPTPTPSPPR